ncbi:MAG TPA: nicotinamidase, partial [Polyangia bacterium]
MRKVNELPLPPFVKAAHAAEWGYRPDQQRLFEVATAWRRDHAIAPAAADRKNVHLLLIDVQKDFCFPEGSLYVAGRSGRGAIDDNRRLCEFMYHNLGAITNVSTTLDTHFAFQIFFPSFWIGADDQPLAPYRELGVDDIRAGRARPNPAVASWLCNGNYA